jgi:hypothetical protein
VRIATHGVVALAVLFGVVHSGGRYFYCPAMGLLASDPCAAAASDTRRKSQRGALSETHVDCCEVVTLPSMPEGARPGEAAIPPAFQVAIVPARARTSPTAAIEQSRAERRFARWRPPPRSANDARAALMVFLV